jgi:hypothetical protein
MDWSDLWPHLLAYPIYQVLSTIRHELAHALAAVLSGWEVTEIGIFPSKRNDKWYWGYCSWSHPTDPRRRPNVHMSLAPYYVNAAVLCAGAGLVMHLHSRFPPHAWIAFIILFIISPVVDTLYNLLKWKIKGCGDFQSAVDTLERQKTQ